MAPAVAKAAALWHAFDALKQADADTVPRARLKVLTQNIGSAIGLANVEHKLDGHGSSLLTFQSYLGFVQSEIFNHIHQTALSGRRSSSLEKVNEVCWLLCCHGYQNRKPAVLESEDLFIFWKIFNTLVEYDMEGLIKTPAVVELEEIINFASEFSGLVGTRFDADEFDGISSQHCFTQVAELFENRLCRGVSLGTIRSALLSLQDEYVFDVLKKGTLLKKGQKAKTLKERWFVLTPSVLRYFTGPDENECKGEVIVNRHWKLQVLSDARKGTYRYKLKVSAPGRELELAAKDVKTRGDWQTAVMSAVDHCWTSMTPREFQRETRRVHREHHRMRQERISDQVERHRQRCKTAEERIEQILALRQEDQKQLADLWKLKQKLEMLLDRERRIREDEKETRNLHERVLREEEARRRNLELNNTQLKRDLETERQQSGSHLDSLKEERNKLQELQLERTRIDDELKEKRRQLQEAEEAKEILKEKLSKKQLFKSTKIAELAAHLPDEDEMKIIESHRGLGAFYWEDKHVLHGANSTHYKLAEQQNDTSEYGLEVPGYALAKDPEASGEYGLDGVGYEMAKEVCRSEWNGYDCCDSNAGREFGLE